MASSYPPKSCLRLGEGGGEIKAELELGEVWS